MRDAELRRNLLAEYDRLLNDPKSAARFVLREDLDRAYATFRREFGPEVLVGLQGRDLLLKMHDRGTTSLMYWLEFKNDDELPRVFGSISGGSALKFQLFKRARDGAWITGTPKHQQRIDEDEAAQIALRQRDYLLLAAERLQRISDPTSTAEYSRLQQELDDIDSNFFSLAWVHKYLHLCFPDRVDDYHNIHYQRFHLLKSLIRPADGWGRYLNAPLYARFADELGLVGNHLSSLLNAVQGEPSRWYRLNLGPLSISEEGAQEMVALGILSLGGDDLPDLTGLPSNQEVKDWLREQTPSTYMEMWRLVNLCTERDRVLVNAGTKSYLADITGPYEYAAGAAAFRHRRSAAWYELPSSFEVDNASLPNSPFGEIQDSNASAILEIEMAAEHAPEARVAPAPTTNRADARIEPLGGIRGRIQQSLDRRRQVILYGPPGTGKTYWATSAARELASRHTFGRSWSGLDAEEQRTIWGESDSLVRFCTFHPAYGYEDFIEGYRPLLAGDQLAFELVPGVFRRICSDAQKHPEHRYYLLIDEINRGDIPRIFGELISLIESDKRGSLSAQLPMSGDVFAVPRNVYLVGTMNTADRSIALLDSALRRRFGFIELLPDPLALGDATIGSFRLADFLSLLNERIVEALGEDGRNLQVGHAYLFLDGKPVDSVRGFAMVLDEEICPLLQEYCYGRLDLLETILGPQLLDGNNGRIAPSLLVSGNEEGLLAALFAAFQELGETATGEIPEATEDETTEPDLESDL